MKTITIHNRQIGRDYSLGSKIVAGLSLTGQEVGIIRQGRLSLKNAYVNVLGNQAYLQNLQLFPTHHQSDRPVSPRAIPLLLTIAQMKKLRSDSSVKGATIVISKIILGKYIKIEIAVGIGKRKHDKREILKQRDAQRDIRRRLKRQ